jgi:hypothetical protein
MRVIGIRVSTDHFRYAVLDLDANDRVIWVNSLDEHRWMVPKSADSKPKRYLEVRREFARILEKYKPNKVVLKISETVRGGPSPDRIGAEAMIILACGEQDTPVSERLYSQLKPDKSTLINTKTVQVEALKYVGQSSTHWDAEMADALIVGIRELGK